MEYKYNLFNSPYFINLEITLNSGQSFSFKSTNFGFIGPINNKLYILRNYIINKDNIEINKNIIEYICLNKSNKEECEKDLFNFFNLQLNYKNIPHYISGLCILKIDIIECIFSFICSTNNNIKRITKMVSYLFTFGEAYTFNNEIYYTFPDIKYLINIENELIKNKFGYRSKSICETAKELIKYDFNLLKTYSDIFNKLIQLRGIGPKVADCICLYSFGYLNIVPIDIHIFRQSILLFNLKKVKLNKKLMLEIKEKWKDYFGEFAGVVQIYIFYKSINLKN